MNNFHTTNPNFSNYNKGIYLTSAVTSIQQIQIFQIIIKEYI